MMVDWFTLGAFVGATGGGRRQERETIGIVQAGQLLGATGLELFGYVPPGSSALLGAVQPIERVIARPLVEVGGDAGRWLRKAAFP